MTKDRLALEVVPGYSCAGWVIQLGEGIEDLVVGERVACGGAGFASHAEIVAVPRNLVVRVPEDIDLATASTVTLGAIALQGVRQAELTLGDRVGVIGLGAIGFLTVQLCRGAGARVLGVDVDPTRVALARGSRCDWVVHSQAEDPGVLAHQVSDGFGLDAVLVTAATSSDEPIRQAMQMARRKGRIVVVGDVGLHLRREEMYPKELDLRMATSYGPGRYDPTYEEGGLDYPYAYVRWTENRNMQAYLECLAMKRCQVDPLLTTVYAVEAAPEAYRCLQADGGRPLTTLIRYPAQEHRQAHLTRSVTVARGRPAADRVRLAVIGAGSFACSTHLPNLHLLRDQFALMAVVSRRGANALSVTRKYQADRAVTDYREVLADSDVDAVLICTRHNLHAQLTLEALSAGKHVFVEKPVALIKGDLEKLQGLLVDLSEKSNAPTLFVGYNRRFSACARRLRELLADRINPLQVHYRMNAGVLPADHWVHGPEGGGRIIGEACHIFDLFTFLTGASPVEICARAIIPRTAAARARENFTAIVRFSDGSVCTLLYSALGAKDVSKEYAEVYADGTTFILDDYRSLKVYGRRAAGIRSGKQDKGHLAELKAFHEQITGRRTVLSYPEELLSAARISLDVDNQILGVNPVSG
ncbi:MAG: bi-domain-containing oxidoreductase [Acidobacteriota bacterium]